MTSQQITQGGTQLLPPCYRTSWQAMMLYGEC